MMRQFPFSALVGQDALKTALLINAVDPLIGGVLIRGHKGSGKSTAARALRALQPPLTVIAGCPYHCDPDQPDTVHEECRKLLMATQRPATVEQATPMVELPLSASEDRIVGTLDIETALSTGGRHFEPGLLAAANRGILYVDEVNLLPDHLVDLLLDAAASGVNVVEREGIRHIHPARFLMIGTMNPEEGELRPQFLDRFGFCLSVTTIDEPQLRSEIIRRRIAFEADPEAFISSYREEEMILRAQISMARKQVRDVALPDHMLDKAVEIAIAAEVQGHRTEITLVRAAKALAALLEKDAVSEAELAEVARLVLPHRLASSPLERPEDRDQRISDILAKSLGLTVPTGHPLGQDAIDMMDNHGFPGSAAAGSMLFTYLKKKARSAHSSRLTISS